MEGHWKFLGEGGSSRFLEAVYGNKLEFPGGGGCKTKKNFHGGSMDIFWNCLRGKKLNYKMVAMDDF